MLPPEKLSAAESYVDHILKPFEHHDDGNEMIVTKIRPLLLAEMERAYDWGIQAGAQLRGEVNVPELENFAEGVVREAVHQRDRWHAEHDTSKSHGDWFWLLGHLSSKALMSATAAKFDKALHHTITAAAVLYHWHEAIKQTREKWSALHEDTPQPATLADAVLELSDALTSETPNHDILLQMKVAACTHRNFDPAGFVGGNSHGGVSLYRCRVCGIVSSDMRDFGA